MSKFAHPSHLVAILAACGLAFNLLTFEPGPFAAAESSTTDSFQSTIQYRRIYVPAGKIETWPRDGEKYIPVEARDFESWIRSANEAHGQDSRATIAVAEYTATIDNGRLQGDGQWTIALHGEKPAFLPLGSTSLVIRDAQWQDSPQQPVRIGLWGSGGQEPARFGLEVRRSGVLKFGWHIETHAMDDHLEIPLRIPTANSVRLVLDLPEGKQPRIDGGVVLESTPRPSDDRVPGKPLRRWVIALSPSLDTNLHIVNTDRKMPAISAQMAMRENVTYNIGARGLDMNVTWQLDRPAEQKRELSVVVPAGTQLTSLTVDGRDLPWLMVRDTSSPTDIALIELPKTDSAKTVQIKFNAWQPSVQDVPWRLPRFRPEGLLWTTGKFEISVAPDLELKRLEPKDCVETGVRPMNSETNAPETHALTAYSPSAAVEISLSRRRTVATVRSGSSLALADPDLNGRLVSQWKLSDGATQQLRGKLAAGWIVEAVETSPADAMAEWFIDRHGEERRIEIQLSRAARVERNVSVIITARLQRFGLAEPISADSMRIVSWSGARTAKHLLTFQPNEPYSIEPVGAMPTVSRDAIEDSDRALLDQTADTKIFDITDAGKDAGLQLTFRRGQYTAHIDHETIYENEVLRHEYRVTAQPDSNPIDRLIVYTSAELGDDVRWTDRASNAPLAAERLSDNDVHRAKLPKDGKLWVLRFPQPSSRQIAISATFSTKSTKRALVPLFYLPEALQQEARVLVRTRNPKSIWLETSHLQSIPLPLETQTSRDAASIPPVCAAYRYQPVDFRNATRAPTLRAFTTSQRVNEVAARHIQLESYYWPDGSGTHSATYQLENRGAPDLKFVFPDDARLTTAFLDGSPVDVARSSGNKQTAIIRLPPLAHTTRLSIYFETLGPPIKAGSKLTPPRVFVDLPFFAGDWIVWLPEEYSATGSGLTSASSDFNWRRRLFGLLGRPTGAQTFIPLRLADGASINNSLTDGKVIDSQTEAAEQQPQTISTQATGWRRYHQTFVANEPTAIIVMHPPATTAWAVVLLLICLVCGRWLRRRKPEAFAVAVAIAAAAALLLPAANADLGAGAVLGFLLSLFADWPRRSISADEFSVPPRVKTSMATALAVAVIIGLTKHSAAESPKTDGRTQNASSPDTYRVLIPTGPDGHPSGTKFYLSEKFLRALIPGAFDAALFDGQWLLRDTTFSGELTEKSGASDIVAGNWTMAFSIETLARDTTVVLPLVENEANWGATAMLDGVPLPVKWRSGGRGCTIKIAEPGQYSISVSCVPKTAHANGRNTMELTIPPIAGSKVEIQAAETVAGLVVSNAPVLPRQARASNLFHAEVGRTAKLNIQWSRSEKPEDGKQSFNLTELRWLDIKPSETDLRVKYVLEGGAHRPNSLAVAYDKRWKLITTEEPVANEPANPAGQQVVRVSISSETSDRQEITLCWRLIDPLALGNLRLPPLELISVPTSRRWLAVSIDPSRQCEFIDSSATDGTANEFCAKWGAFDSEMTPQLVLSNLEAGAMPILSVRPREMEPDVEETAYVAAGLRALRVRYEANVTPGSFGAYQFEFSVPTDLSVDEIILSQDDKHLPLRWSRSAKNRVTVFFSREIAKAYQLFLNGSVPLDASRKANLPHISTVATAGLTQTVQLYRDDDVHVDLEGGVSATPESKLELIDTPPIQWRVRPIGTYFLDNNAATAARVAIKPLDSKVAGDTLIALSRENGSWFASYRCQLLAEGDELDVLRLRVPPTWMGPFDVQSAQPVSTEIKTLDEQNAILTVRFAASVGVGKAIDLRIRSPLKISNGTGVSVPAITVAVPAITVESVSRGRRFVSVPQLTDSQPMLWTEIGVRPVTVSQKLIAGFAIATPAHTFEVINDPFQVASRAQDLPEVAPQIRLADTAIVAGDIGSQLIVTRLILAPRGLSMCTFQLPQGQSLVTARLDGRPALIRPLDQARWELALGARHLPQTIEIFSRSDAGNSSSGRAELQRPILLANGKTIPAEVSLWSFAHPQKLARRTIEGADEVSAREQAALRFDRLLSIAEVAKTAATEMPSPDGFNWFEPWARLIAGARSKLQETTAVPDSVRPESQVSRTNEEQINLATKRLEKWLDDCRKNLAAPDLQKETELAFADDFSLASLSTAPGTGPWTYYVAEGGSDRLAMQLRLASPTTSQIRIVGLLLIVILLIGTIWLMRWPAALDFVCRWPHALGIIIGIAWWACMWPSWLGVLIVAACLWLSLRFNWPGRSFRTEASTILRSTRTI